MKLSKSYLEGEKAFSETIQAVYGGDILAFNKLTCPYPSETIERQEWTEGFVAAANDKGV